MKFLNLVLPLVLVIFASCAKNVKSLIEAGVIPGSKQVTLPLSSPASGTLHIVYTGCGGLMISTGEEAILTDPYYTGQRMHRLITGIKIKPKNIRKVFARLNSVATTSTNIKAVLVAHSHYDHLQDLPYLLVKNLLPADVKLFGSPSMSCTVSKFMEREVFVNANDSIHGMDSVGKWIMVSPHIRVMAIRAGHAPHLGEHQFMEGSTCDKGFTFFNRPRSRTTAFKWKNGTVYSFLIDILKDDGKTPEFRIFLQSSSCNAPVGFPPKDAKEVDLAILGVALAQNVNGYPNTLLSYLGAKKVMLIHWEDFFRDIYHKKPKSVRKTDMDKFVNDLKTHFKVNRTEELTDFVVMPQPLTDVKMEY